MPVMDEPYVGNFDAPLTYSKYEVSMGIAISTTETLLAFKPPENETVNVTSSPLLTVVFDALIAIVPADALVSTSTAKAVGKAEKTKSKHKTSAVILLENLFIIIIPH